MNVRSNIIILLLFCLVFGLAESAEAQRRKKKDKKPAWIENPANAYSQKDYLLAVGSGDTQQSAQNSAMGNLSRIFQSNIKAEQTLLDDMKETSGTGKGLTFERTEQLISATTIGSNVSLINTNVLETYLDKDGIYYALAGMKRKETASIYRTEIDNNYEAVKNFEESAKNAPSKLARLRYLKGAVTLCAANENLKQQLSVIRGSGFNDPFDSDIYPRVRDEYAKVQEETTVKITMENENENIRNAVAEMFQKSGFSISDSDSPVVEAFVDFTSEEMDMGRADATFAKWSLAIRFTDNETNRDVKTFNTEGRDGAASYAAAVIRAEFNARKKITKDLPSFIQNEFLKVD